MTILEPAPAAAGDDPPTADGRAGDGRVGREGGGARPGWRRYMGALGPGLVTGASDDDPSGIATYAQAGAQFRYASLWTVIISLPLMLAVQEICDRTALATGQSLGRLARRRFGSRVRLVIGVLLVALLVANALNIAADLMAIGQGMQLLHAGSAPLWSGLSGAGLILLLIRGSFELIGKIFKWLCLTLLTYVAVLFAARVSWSGVLRGLIGMRIQLGGAYWVLIVAILGTTISPYLFFWQTAHRVEEMRDEDLGGEHAPPLRRRGRSDAARKLRESRVDVFAGMALSQLVMFAIITTTGATLGAGKPVTITSAADAAKALQPVAGGLSETLFALGFIGSGLLAVPVLAGSASVGIAGLLDKDWGFTRSPRKAPLFYSLVGVGVIGGILLSIFSANPIGLLVFVALVNGIAAAPFLIVTMIIAGNRELMGEHRNGALATILGWSAAAVMGVAAILGLWQTIAG